jgi:hypothetical protein
MKIFRDIGWPLAVLIFFIIVLSLLLVKEINAMLYRSKSIPHEVEVDLGNDVGWEEMRIIQDGLRYKTHQPAPSFLVDRGNKIFRVRVMCPPDDLPMVLEWLRSRRWVEHAEL